jgi:hypothetical protein
VSFSPDQVDNKYIEEEMGSLVIRQWGPVLLWNGLIEKHHFVTQNEFLILGDIDLWI